MIFKLLLGCTRNPELEVNYFRCYRGHQSVIDGHSYNHLESPKTSFTQRNVFVANDIPSSLKRSYTKLKMYLYMFFICVWRTF